MSLAVTGTGDGPSEPFPVQAFVDVPDKVAFVGVPLDPYVPVIGWGDFATISFAISPPLPAGLVFDRRDGTVSGTPAAASARMSHRVIVRDASGREASGTFAIAVEGPSVARPDTAFVAGGATTRIAVADNDLGGPFRQVMIASLPTYGDARVDGLDIIYRAYPFSDGTDVFTYRIVSEDGRVALGTVTMRVAGPKEPVRRPVDADLNAAQSLLARRSAEIQLDNFADRLQSLHRDVGDVPYVAGLRLVDETGTAAGTSNAVPATIDGTGQSRFSYWNAGSLAVAKRPARPGVPAIAFETQGISGGIDVRLAPELTVGIGAGMAHEVMVLGDDSEYVETVSYDRVVYGSWRPVDGLYLDGAFGVGRLTFASIRRSVRLADPAHGVRHGRRRFGTLIVGWDGSGEVVALAPYGALTATQVRLSPFTEEGGIAHAHGWAEESSLEGTLGLRATTRIPVMWATLRPKGHVEWHRSLDWRNAEQIAFTDDSDGQTFNYGSHGGGDDSLVTGLGLELENGPFRLWVDWSRVYAAHGFRGDSLHAGLRLRL